VVERLISGVIALAVVVSALLWGGELAVEIIVGLVVLIGLDEWARMTAKETLSRSLSVLLPTGGACYIALIWCPPSCAVPVIAFSAIVVLCYGLLGVRDTAEGARAATTLLTGLVYVPGLLVFVPWIRTDFGLDWLFLMLIVTWCGDTGAYFAGRALGKRKLFERISPKKTWEGAIGGTLLSIVGALVIRAVDPSISPGGLETVPWVHMAVLGLLINISGVIGDLVESLFKRAHDVKDSGWIMPGHGGILDRVDSILFTAPVTWIYAMSFGLG
jgi:phosphatidate cytidylyltransferase